MMSPVKGGCAEADQANVDPVTIGLQLGYFILFGVSAYQLARHRGPLELSVFAIFGSYAALFLLSFLNALLPSLSPIARPVLVALLFAQPYLVVRLVDQIRPVSTTLKRVTILGSIAAWEAIVLVPPIATAFASPNLTPLATVVACFYFFAVELWAAARMASLSQRRDGALRGIAVPHRPLLRAASSGRPRVLGIDDAHPGPGDPCHGGLSGRVRPAWLVPPAHQPCRVVPARANPRRAADRDDCGVPVDRPRANRAG